MVSAQVQRRGRGWVVQVQRDPHTVLEYRCASEQRARFMVAVFGLQPATLPPPDAVRPLAAPAPKAALRTARPTPSGRRAAAQA